MMDSSPDTQQPQQGSSSPDAPILQVDFSWKKFKALITEVDKPSEPLYIVEFQVVKSPLILVKSAADGKVVGSGSLHPFSINAGFELHGEKGQLKALKRWKTQYTHLSRAYSDGKTPTPMTWTSKSDFKTWDFICMDEKQVAVAKFSARNWSMTKIGNIEFQGPKAGSPAARDEIVVTGLTLLYCMLLRASSLLSFFGAFFARPGPIKQQEGAESQGVVGDGDQRDESVLPPEAAQRGSQVAA